jgi:hypothetical protein
MAVWETYPASYRATEVSAILRALKAGECAAVIGLSGAGKSNLMGFLARRVTVGPAFALVDCNRLAAIDAAGLFELLAEALGTAPDAATPVPAGLRSLEKLVEARLREHPQGLCLLLDRFDAFGPVATGNLRALRDAFKYRLTYVTAGRRPLDPGSELAELFFANTLWLGPLSRDDARWSVEAFAARHEERWDEATLESILTLSWGYPALLRAVCEAHYAGAALEVETLRAHPAVKRRADEFWSDAPSPEDLRLSRLEGQPLLDISAPLRVDPAGLTAAEQRLLDYLRGHSGAVCSKDDLIAAVWPEEAAAGLRDDSLAQLVHRLREKVESNPAAPRRIQTLAGRGYRFQG